MEKKDSRKRSRRRHITEEDESPQKQMTSIAFWNTGKNAIDPSPQISKFHLSGHSVLHRHFHSGPCLVSFVCHHDRI